MGDLSLWDILLLKDEISVWEWVLYSVVIPIVVVLGIIGAIIIYEYGSEVWWNIRYRIRERKKRKARE